MFKPGEQFERYMIEAVIGQGGMGTVYRAYDTQLERKVALKVITDAESKPEARARLLREARAAAALDHPNAVAIFDVGEVGGAPYIVMELIGGRTLREAALSAASIERRITWLADTARVLAEAHRRGLVHRDIKPDNVMVRGDDGVKVLDFGIARRAFGDVDPTAATELPALPTLTLDGAVAGTPLYMAPELIRGAPCDGRVDQFSWGVLAYEVLAGRLPWRGAGAALAALASILTDEPESEPLDRAGVPAVVKAVVLRALAKRPEGRFASMDELLRALDGAARAEASQAARSTLSGAVRASSSGLPSAARPSDVAPVAGATLLRRYSEEEVKEILARAIEQQESRRADVKLGFDDLLDAARELGVDAATLREASHDVRLREQARRSSVDDDARRDAWLRRKRRGFYRHLGVYIITNLAFLLLGLLRDKLPETLIPALFWGIGLGIHGLTALTANRDDWEAREVRRRRRDRRPRNAGAERVIEDGAALLIKTGETRRQRIAAPEPSTRHRIDIDAADSAMAEDEAAESAADGRRRRRRR